MIFKICSFLTLVLALSSLDAATVVASVPTDIDYSVRNGTFYVVDLATNKWVILLSNLCRYVESSSNYDRSTCNDTVLSQDLVSCFYFLKMGLNNNFMFFRLSPYLGRYVETKNDHEPLWT